ncbi:putative f-box domain protein [Phaeomoniella chlamydospora]|uniref:Putative f-box domain protein n=1 Tax=Phaeomoniella chlamydospora TaxID=158046 RepID=A0A0G2GZD7_PHACM|nr:putative f-box domain protein [Phaeomoniella chlamydospora]
MPDLPSNPDDESIAADAADAILVAIMASVDTLEDLFSTALINRGFYLTFKRHELQLTQDVLFKTSPAAWELREMCPPKSHFSAWPQEIPVTEYTSSAYYSYYKSDYAVLTTLKSLMLTRCQTLLRMETIIGLAGMNEQRSKELDDAFWRISSFCVIFGSGKNREHDIIGQLDWLRGGEFVRESAMCPCRPTSITTEDMFDPDSALLNPPESFGKGNGYHGISATQLYDMLEIWNCLGVLLQPLSTDVLQAKHQGVLQKYVGSDTNRELETLEEWICYILTLGPSTVLSLCPTAPDVTGPSFARAKVCGWTKWTPPELGYSRSAFLKEAVTRLYSERLAALASPQSLYTRARQPNDNIAPASKSSRSPTTRNRQLALAVELRQTKQESFTNPSTDCRLHRTFSTERPMSVYPQIMSQLTQPQQTCDIVDSPQTYDYDLASNPQDLNYHLRSLSDPTPYSGNDPSTETSNHADPIETALDALTSDFGFSIEEAAWALQKCENGQRIQIDRAVDLLLRQRELGHSTAKKLGKWMVTLQSRTTLRFNTYYPGLPKTLVQSVKALSSLSPTNSSSYHGSCVISYLYVFFKEGLLVFQQ